MQEEVKTFSIDTAYESIAVTVTIGRMPKAQAESFYLDGSQPTGVGVAILLAEGYEGARLEFTPVMEITEFPASMTINIAGNTVAVVDFLGNYLNAPFTLDDGMGNRYERVFTNGIININ